MKPTNEVKTDRNLTDDECWQLLESQEVGRLATAAAGEPEIFPVNFAVGGRALYINTTPGSKLVEIAVNRKVAFEIDQWGPDLAYSVVVKGTAKILETEAERAEATATGLVSFTTTDKEEWVRITPTEVTGRQIGRA